MPSIPDNFFDDLIAKVDLADLMGRYMTLKKAGSRFMAVCPFHGDTKPSLSISPDRGLWYCFGCQEGGTAITFIQKKENLEFIEAVRFIAQIYGIPVPEGTPDPHAARRKTLYDINEQARELYSKVLKSKQGKRFREYLKSRGFKGDTVLAYKIGASPVSWDFVAKRLIEAGFAAKDLIDSGIVLPGKKGGIYDRFRGRLMVPIIDNLDRTLGFGGRAMGDDEPKYINSPESPIFHKSKVLFGLNLAKDACRETSRLIVMEGYTDVMHACQAGVRNCCAVMGTALTEEHIPLLRRFADEVILSFDGDEAGRRAALKSLFALAGSELTVRVLDLPLDVDPADFITREGSDKFRKLIDESVAASDWVFRTFAAPVRDSGLADKIRRFEEVASFITAHKSSAVRDELLENACIAFNCPLPPLADVLEKSRTKERAFFARTDPGTLEAFMQGGEMVERTLFLSLLAHPRYLPDVRDSLDPEDFYLPLHRRLARLLFEQGFALGTSDGLTRIPEVYDDRDLNSLVVGLVIELDNDAVREKGPLYTEEALRFSLLGMIKRKFDTESKNLQTLMRELQDSASSEVDKTELQERLQRRRDELEEQYRAICESLSSGEV
jgi:DNA primase